MISWIITVALLVTGGAAIVIAEIRDDRALRRYNRQRDERIKQIFRNLPR